MYRVFYSTSWRLEILHPKWIQSIMRHGSKSYKAYLLLSFMCLKRVGSILSSPELNPFIGGIIYLKH